MPDRQVGVIEVILRVANHPDLFHNATRLHVANSRQRNDLIKLQFMESKQHRGEGPFRRVPAIPIRSSQPPSDLYGGSEMCLKRTMEQADEAGEIGLVGNLDRPESETVPLEMILNPLHRPIALLARER